MSTGLLPACFPAEVRERHASVVEDFLAAPGQEGLVASDPVRAVGPPDGRTVAIGQGSFVILRFFRAIPDGPGVDFRIFEVGEDGAEARVAVSADGQRFFEFPDPAQGPISAFDLAGAGLGTVTFVRLRGIDDRGQEPGFDLDAMEALH